MSTFPNKDPKTNHFVLISSAGMGHIGPFCRLASALSTQGCAITFVAALPTVSNAEYLHISDLIASHPSIHLLNLPLIPLSPTQYPPDSHDPFFLRFEAIRRSAHFLPPLLNSVPGPPPISAAIIDISLISAFFPVTKHQLNLPSYVMFISSLAMLSLVAHFPTYVSSNREIGDVDIPGLMTVRKSSLPPPLLDPTHLFRLQFVENGGMIRSTDGILVNSFKALEPMDITTALNLPPVYQIGPLASKGATTSSSSNPTVLEWLEKQPRKSVVYVSFGSRSAMGKEQIRELGRGLERSGKRFLWVVKSKKVDREEEEGVEVDEVVGEAGFWERVKGRGMVVNGWVEQEEVLEQGAVGLFVSHCGWNSVTEAGRVGVRVLGWPRNGDQRVNGEVVRRSGLGEWMDGWSWEGEDGVVGAEEIGRKVKEVMEDEELEKAAGRVGMEARKAVGAGGSSRLSLDLFLESC